MVDRQARVDFHKRWRKNVSDKGTPRTISSYVGKCLSDIRAAKNFIRVLHPVPKHWLTTAQKLSHPWLTSLATPTKPDPCGLHENIDSRARWHNVIDLGGPLTVFEE